MAGPSPLAGQLSGFASGFDEASTRMRKENSDRAERDEQREQNILLSLANSPDVLPEVRSAAVTGLLTKQPGKSSGLDKWFGKQTSHPAFGLVHSMLGQAPGQGANPVQPPMGGGVGIGEQAAQQGFPNAPSSRSGPSGPTNGQNGLISPPGQGIQPSGGPPNLFYAPGEREGMHAAAVHHATIQAQLNELELHKNKLSPAQYQQSYQEIITGRGVPRAGTASGMKSGTIVFEGGESAPGYFGADGQYYVEDPDQGMVEVSQTGKKAIRFVPSGNLTAGTGARPTAPIQTTMSAKQFQAKYGYLPQGVNANEYVRVRDHGDGNVEVQATQYTPPSSFTFIPTTEGLVRGNTKSGTVSPVPGGGSIARPVTPEANASSLRALAQDIERRAKADSTQFGMLDTDEQKKKLDEYTKATGQFTTWAELQAALGQATGAVGGFVPSTPPPRAGRGQRPQSPKSPPKPNQTPSPNDPLGIR